MGVGKDATSRNISMENLLLLCIRCSREETTHRLNMARNVADTGEDQPYAHDPDLYFAISNELLKPCAGYLMRSR